MPEQEQIDALKAQVNCLRMRVADGMNVIANEYPEDQWDYYGYSDMRKALEATPEQCLAEVKAKAIEDAVKANTHFDRDCDGDSYSWIAPRGMRDHVKKLREQAK